MAVSTNNKDRATSLNNDFGFSDAHCGHAHVMQVFEDGMGMTELLTTGGCSYWCSHIR